MASFRIVVVDETNGTLSEMNDTLQLDERPARGDRLKLPNGRELIVRHVRAPEREAVAPTIFGKPA